MKLLRGTIAVCRNRQTMLGAIVVDFPAYEIEVHSEKALFEEDAINYKISLSFHFSRMYGTS